MENDKCARSKCDSKFPISVNKDNCKASDLKNFERCKSDSSVSYRMKISQSKRKRTAQNNMEDSPTKHKKPCSSPLLATPQSPSDQHLISKSLRKILPAKKPSESVRNKTNSSLSKDDELNDKDARDRCKLQIALETLAAVRKRKKKKKGKHYNSQCLESNEANLRSHLQYKVSPSKTVRQIADQNRTTKNSVYAARNRESPRASDAQKMPQNIKQTTSSAKKVLQSNSSIPSSSSNTSCMKQISEKTTTKYRTIPLENSTVSSVKSLQVNKSGTTSTCSSTSTELIGDVEMFDVSSEPLQDARDVGSTSRKKCYFVLDTNILMSELNFVDNLKDVPYKDFGLPHIYIPWIVFQELDGLKNNVSRQLQATKAVNYLHNKLLSKHPRFHGQSSKLAGECHDLSSHCNDDDVMNCCLQLQNKVPNDEVILLTNDKNLCNKALVSGVKTHTIQSFKKLIDENKKSLVTTQTKPNCVLNLNDIKLESPHITNEVMDLLKHNVRLILRTFLEPFLSEAITHSFGDLGKKFLPPNSCSLLDILNCFKKYWTSVFMCVLPKTFLDHLETFKLMCNTNASSVCDMNSILSVLLSAEIACQEILKVSVNCQLNGEIALNQTQSLIAQCKAFLKANLQKLQENEPLLQESKAVVLAVLDHIWALINHLCGMIMDFLEKPHNLSYEKPEVLPSKEEFQDLILRLYPGVHKIKKTYQKVLNDGKPQDIRNLHKFLVQFIPSLQIQATDLPQGVLSIAHLRNFCLDVNNHEIMVNGFTQLVHFFEILEKCLRDPMWKR